MGLGNRSGTGMSAEKTSHQHKKSAPNSEFKLNSRSGLGGYLNSSIGGPRTMFFLSENESSSTKMFPS